MAMGQYTRRWSARSHLLHYYSDRLCVWRPIDGHPLARRTVYIRGDWRLVNHLGGAKSTITAIGLTTCRESGSTNFGGYYWLILRWPTRTNEMRLHFDSSLG